MFRMLSGVSFASTPAVDGVDGPSSSGLVGDDTKLGMLDRVSRDSEGHLERDVGGVDLSILPHGLKNGCADMASGMSHLVNVS